VDAASVPARVDGDAEVLNGLEAFVKESRRGPNVMSG
jgi:hypothetical protein